MPITSLSFFPSFSLQSCKPSKVILLKEWHKDNHKIQLYLQGHKIIAKQLDLASNITTSINEVVGIPKELACLPEKLKIFLSDTYTTVSHLNDGSDKLYIKQKLKGGGNTIDPSEDQDEFWPNGVIPYAINDKDFPKGSEKRKQILAALKAWKEAKTGFTFIKRTTQQDYIYFENYDPSTCKSNQSASQSKHKHSSKDEHQECESKCDSYVGRQGGKQKISCDLISESFNTASLIHEIGHAIGLYHEHQRDDRDNYVKVNSTDEANYGIEGEKYGKYDFYSIMHYPIDEDMRLKTKNSQLEKTVGEQENLSNGDIEAARFIYQKTMEYYNNKDMQQLKQVKSELSENNRSSSTLFRRPNDIHNIYSEAQRLQNDGQYWLAFDKYHNLISNHSKNAFVQSRLSSIYNDIGICLGNSNQHESALDYFQRSLMIDNNLHARFNEGLAFKILGYYHYAIESFQMIPRDRVIIRSNSLYYQACQQIEELNEMLLRSRRQEDEEPSSLLSRLCMS